MFVPTCVARCYPWPPQFLLSPTILLSPLAIDASAGVEPTPESSCVSRAHAVCSRVTTAAWRRSSSSISPNHGGSVATVRTGTMAATSAAAAVESSRRAGRPTYQAKAMVKRGPATVAEKAEAATAAAAEAAAAAKAAENAAKAKAGVSHPAPRTASSNRRRQLARLLANRLASLPNCSRLSSSRSSMDSLPFLAALTSRTNAKSAGSCKQILGTCAEL